jgi:hypothetical protein
MTPMLYRFCFLVLAVMAGSTPAQSEIVRVEIDSREPVLGGKTFDAYGPYEIVRGRLYFAFEPASPINAQIVDLQRAPRNSAGRVEAWTVFTALQPMDPDSARGIALVEVSNRGDKFSLSYFNRAASASLDPNDPDAFGDALLMRLGLTVIWIGWQFDAPDRPGVLRLHVPRARQVDGSPITGLVRSDWTIDSPAASLALAHRDHRAYPVADPEDSANILTVRDGREAPRRVISRDRWHFARLEDGRRVPDATHIVLEGEFEAGKIYELVYRAQDPAVVGLGLAAIRDVISYAKYDTTSIFPAKVGLAAGVSQTGRFLRHFLYQGFNTDEQGRLAYDGMMIIAAGAGRGSFNHRFAQPSRDGHRYSTFFYPTDLFPFTSATQFDPLQWRRDGLLAHLANTKHAPKTFYINTGYEYWGRAASLIHTTPDGTADVPPLPHERIYHLASGQHFVGAFPEADDRLGNGPAYRSNPLDFSGNYRALFVRLVDWVETDTAPPASAYPTRTDGTLVKPFEVVFPAIPGVTFPQTIHVAYRADYGPRWSKGIIDLQPPRLAPSFPSLVAQVDSLGNERGGVRNVELRVPLATYTPWSLRTGYAGNSSELADFVGMVIPLPRTEAERQATGDTRPAIATLYDSRQAYLTQVRRELQDLISAGFLLTDDLQRALKRAGRTWNRVHSLER